MTHPSTADPSNHEAVSLLLPWYVNGTLNAADRQRVDAHLARCVTCRHDLSLEDRIYARAASEAVIEHIPAASLKRLQARLDDLASEALPEPRRRRTPLRPVLPWLGAMAASVVVSVGAVALYMQGGKHAAGEGTSAPYYTVTDPEVRSPNEVIRAVFAPNITLVELQGLLDEAQLKIVSGPTEAGVYSLAARSARPVNLSLALLRQHQTVRFAEITRERAGNAAVDNTP